jgi:hypothetical protein
MLCGLRLKSTEADLTSRRAFVKLRCTAPTSTFSCSAVATESQPTSCSRSIQKLPRAWSNLCAPKTIASERTCRHLLTAGIDLISEAGAVRIKIVFRPDNPAARGLYLSVGFEPVKQTEVLSR